MSHSILPPSAAGIWGSPRGCRGWVRMIRQFAGDGRRSEAADEGVAAHEAAAALLNGGDTPKFASNGVVITPEMIDHVMTYVNDVKQVKNDKWGFESFGVESRLDLSRIHSTCFGTVDAYLHADMANTLYIWDFKYGYKAVEAVDNEQMICYAAGIINRLAPSTKVIMRIVQPRAPHPDGPIREWITTVGELIPRIEYISDAALFALSPTASTRSGAHCRYCVARHGCRSALDAGLGLYEIASEPVPELTSPAQLANKYEIIQRALEQLKYLESGIEEQLKSIVRSGANIPGYCVDSSPGREQWQAPVTDIEALGKLYGVELTKPQPITPNQARKAGIDPDVIAAYSTRSAGSLKLIKDDGSKARKVFTEGI